VIEVIDPSTEAVIDTVPEADAAAVDAAVRGAQAAQPGWAALPLEERCAALDAFADRLAGAADALGETVAREVGMPLAQSVAIQAMLPVADIRSAATEARAYPFEAEEAGARIWHEPVGVVSAITPWNFPLHQIAAKVAPALAVGCTVVLKPSELAPLNALAFAELADFPGGVLTVLPGTAATGEALVRHPGVDAVSLTGSVRAGRAVGAIAGERLRRATLELGGKSPCVVLDDADLEGAIRHAIDRGYLNSGQACNASTRILVPRAQLGRAEEIAAAVAGEIVVGPAFDEGVTMGPLVSAGQRDRVRAYIEDALGGSAAGGGATTRAPGAGADARLIFGGADAPHARGYFLRPTLFSDVDAAAPIAREEIFGPVLCLFGYDDEDHAVALANDTPYGLAAEVFTADPDRGTQVARRLRAGQVKLNGVRTRDSIGAPFGGIGDSGLGRELGRWGLEEFLEVKAVLGA
jgi:acyl-CoA reductase-like NAD-dependent aldehyde dehydrogenase